MGERSDFRLDWKVLVRVPPRGHMGEHPARVWLIPHASLREKPAMAAGLITVPFSGSDEHLGGTRTHR